MSDTTPPLLRLWFLDWHARVIDHDPVADWLAPTPFKPGIFPGMTILVPAQSPPVCKIIYEKRLSLPRPMPELEMHIQNSGLVYFQVPGQELYLKSMYISPGVFNLMPDATLVQRWEQFLPMTENTLRSLSTLMISDAITLTDTSTQTALPPLELANNFIGLLGNYEISLPLNLVEIEKIGSLPHGEAIELCLTLEDGTRKNILARRPA